MKEIETITWIQNGGVKLFVREVAVMVILTCGRNDRNGPIVLSEVTSTVLPWPVSDSDLQ